ncbi:MAG: peptide deformylase [Gammaproteobacteria bacterium]|nr:peptide deformylase [Gammaproteobacteria bacterium]NNJ72491.1 peptide deformylase [Enterobacterales bacterium]
MTVQRILKMGDARLLQQSEVVCDPTSKEIKTLIADMMETMEANNGAGLAAPQIGVFQRIVIFGCESNPRYPDMEPIPMTVLINPKIEILTDEVIESWEGCLSVPGMRGLVPRYSELRYRGVDEHNQPIDRTVSGFHAIVVQHECDHLDGILYPMRMPDMAAFGFEDELAKVPETE